MAKAAKKPGALDATQQLEAHPLCELVPGGLTEDEHAALVEDLRANGVRIPIVLYEGKILDGRARWRAAQVAGVPCPSEEVKGFTDEDARHFVMSTNLHRRTLSGMQKSLAVAELYRRAVNSEGPKPSQETLAKRYGVSKQTISLCLKALDSKNSMLITRMRRGEVMRSELEEEFYDRSSANASVPTGSGNEEADDLLGTAPLPDNVVHLPNSSAGKGGTVGKRTPHPERRTTDTPAQVVANQFKALSEQDRCDFVKLAWTWLELPVAAHQAVKAGKKRKAG